MVHARHGLVTPPSTIVISGDRIAARGPKASTRILAGARILPASGEFVIPGLWDMHVHVGASLANGVTGLREMAASEENAPQQRQYQQDVANGLGPAETQ